MIKEAGKALPDRIYSILSQPLVVTAFMLLGSQDRMSAVTTNDRESFTAGIKLSSFQPPRRNMLEIGSRRD
jgi:hypothetical protein